MEEGGGRREEGGGRREEGGGRREEGGGRREEGGEGLTSTLVNTVVPSLNTTVWGTAVAPIILHVSFAFSPCFTVVEEAASSEIEMKIKFFYLKNC